MPSPEINNPEDAHRELVVAGMRAAHTMRAAITARAAFATAQRDLAAAEHEAAAADAALRAVCCLAARLDVTQ
jgi:hypothetical protein